MSGFHPAFAMSTLRTLVLACLMAGLVPAGPLLHGQTAKTTLSNLDMQILLDRAGFSPGEIDGTRGTNMLNAIAGYEAARMSGGSGSIDDMALAESLGAGAPDTLTTYTITKADAAGPFARTIPSDMMAKAKLKALPYTSLVEALGERFHISPRILRQLNPKSRFAAGDRIRVPNLGTRPAGAAAAGVIVSKSRSTLTVVDDQQNVVFQAPVTSGSEFDPLPLGQWTVVGVARNPSFNYNPDLFWDADPSHAKAKIGPGPNGPVGVVWIEINVEHYGIHGTPEPELVGHSQSHGCVRLTNWDAETVAGMVKKGVPVSFVE